MRVAAVTAAVAAAGNANSGCYFFGQSAQKDGTGLGKLAGSTPSLSPCPDTDTQNKIYCGLRSLRTVWGEQTKIVVIFSKGTKTEERESGNMRSMLVNCQTSVNIL